MNVQLVDAVDGEIRVIYEADLPAVPRIGESVFIEQGRHGRIFGRVRDVAWTFPDGPRVLIEQIPMEEAP